MRADPDRVIAEARGWLGTPYRHRASVRGVGCDCLGLVVGVWRSLHGELPQSVPPYAPDWAEAGGGEPLAEAAGIYLMPRPLDERQPGDVLIFRWRAGVAAKHLAILAHGDRMIHAHDGACVAEVAVTPSWRRRIAYAFSFPASQD